MANWSIIDWTTNPYWSELTNVNDFISAIRERQTAIGDTPLMGLKAEGEDVQLASVWADMQQWIIDHYNDFAISHAAGMRHPVDYYDAAGNVQHYANLAALFSAAGLSTSTFRAYATHPDDGGSDLSHKLTSGEIIGPWIFEDIQKCLNAMIWQQGDVGWDGTASKYGEAGLQFGWLDPNHPGPWAVVKTDVEADWDVVTPGDYAPWATTRARFNFDGDYGAYATRLRSRCRCVDNLGTGISRAIRWFVWATAPPIYNEGDVTEWHNNGETRISEDAWACWLVDSPSSDVTNPFSSDSLGDPAALPFPAWCQEPTADPGDRQDTTKGWEIDYDNCLVQWDVANGFEKKG